MTNPNTPAGSGGTNTARNWIVGIIVVLAIILIGYYAFSGGSSTSTSQAPATSSDTSGQTAPSGSGTQAPAGNSTQ